MFKVNFSSISAISWHIYPDGWFDLWCLSYFNATFNNISVISWWSFLLAEDPEKTTNLSQITDKLLSHNVVLAWMRFELTTLVVIGTDCTGSWKSNYHRITTTTDPRLPRCQHSFNCKTSSNMDSIEKVLSPVTVQTTSGPVHFTNITKYYFFNLKYVLPWNWYKFVINNPQKNNKKHGMFQVYYKCNITLYICITGKK